MSCDLPLRKTMCATCPFSPGSPYANLADSLAESAMSVSRICHSTGSNNGINRRTGLKAHLCRGARDLQLEVMASLGVIDAATDEAWNETRVKMGMEPIVVKNPEKKGKVSDA